MLFVLVVAFVVGCFAAFKKFDKATNNNGAAHYMSGYNVNW